MRCSTVYMLARDLPLSLASPLLLVPSCPSSKLENVPTAMKPFLAAATALLLLLAAAGGAGGRHIAQEAGGLPSGAAVELLGGTAVAAERSPDGLDRGRKQEMEPQGDQGTPADDKRAEGEGDKTIAQASVVGQACFRAHGMATQRSTRLTRAGQHRRPSPPPPPPPASHAPHCCRAVPG